MAAYADSESGRNSLHFAADWQKIEAVHFLTGIDVNGRDDGQEIALHKLAGYVHPFFDEKVLEIVVWLVSHGADVNCRTHAGETLLLLAFNRRQYILMETLLKTGANPKLYIVLPWYEQHGSNARNYMLDQAIINDRGMETIGLLLQHNANTD